MKYWLLVLLFTVLSTANAQTYRRLVNFEWEPIEEAKYYEIEIRKKGQTKASAFTTTTAEWNGRLQVGRYEFRLRALDRRKVPGDWSGYSELDVGLEPAKILSPAADTSLKSSDPEKHEVEFSWSAVPASNGYIVEVFNDKNEKVHEEKTTKTSFKHELKAAHHYTWKVKGISSEGLESEVANLAKFTIVGGKLEKPKIERPDSEFVRDIKWESVEKAESYDIIVAKYNPQLKKWQKFKEFEDFNQTALNFESDWVGGQYRIYVKSKAAIREHSEEATLTFAVRNGDRSPAAEYVHTLRKSIDRVNGWFAHGSWYASSISMESQYKGVLGFDTNATTGTGRLGLGWFKPESKWGFMGIVEASGYVFENKIYNFVGLELSAIRNQAVSARGDVRYHVGVYAKEFPALWTTSTSANNNIFDPNSVNREYGKGGVLGPHVGAEYWYSMTPKLGIQTNAHIYLPMAGMEFPNGGKIKNTMDFNYSVGFLGSYRYSRNLTGLIGINYKVESYSYTDNSDQSGWDSGAYSGRHNGDVKTGVSGIYLNFMAEYSF